MYLPQVLKGKGPGILYRETERETLTERERAIGSLNIKRSRSVTMNKWTSVRSRADESEKDTPRIADERN